MVLCISSGLFGDPIPAAEGPSAQQGAEVMDGGSAPDEAAQERELRAEQLAEAESLVEAFPEDDNAIYLLGLVHLQLGDSESAIATFERCKAMDPDRADLFESLGEAVLIRDAYDQAVEHFTRALTREPSRFSARKKLADTLLRMGRADEVLEVLQGHGAPDPEYYRILGAAHQQLGAFAPARDAFLRAIELDPNLDDAFYGLSMVCARMGETEAAAQYRERFREIKAKGQIQGRDWRRGFSPLEATRRSVAMTNTDVGRVFLSQRRMAPAMRLWERALQLDPRNQDARWHLAFFLLQTGRASDALPHWRELCRSTPDYPRHHFHLGEALTRTGRLEEAESAFQQVIRLAPDRSEGYAGLCNLYLLQKRPGTELLPLAEKAVAIDTSPANLVLLSIAVEQYGDRKAALEAIERAVRMVPDDPKLLRRLQQLSP